MNEQLQEKIISIISWLEASIQKGAEFTVEQTPLVVQEVLQWEFAVSLIGFLSALFLFLASVYGCYRFIRAGIKKEWFWDKSIDMLEPIAMINLFWLFPFTILPIVIGENLEWLQILIAPRLFLLEYVANLIK